jgi:hypothetical protein
MNDVIAVFEDSVLCFRLPPNSSLAQLAAQLAAAAGERPDALRYVAVRVAARAPRAA